MADARNAGAADRLYHPYWRHAANFLGVAFTLVFGATTTWLMGWDERLTMALFAVAAALEGGVLRDPVPDYRQQAREIIARQKKVMGPVVEALLPTRAAEVE